MPATTPMPAEERRVVIENLTPRVEAGRYPAKRVVGDVVEVQADIFRDGHDQLAASLKYRKVGEAAWRDAPMELVENDRWGGRFTVDAPGHWELTVEAWTDQFGSWHRDMQKRIAAAQDVASEVLEGARLVEAAAGRATGPDKKLLSDAAARIKKGVPTQEAVGIMTGGDFVRAVLRWPDRSLAARWPAPVTVYVDRERARFSTWYELFPRSYGEKPGVHGTFRFAAARLAEVRKMGFDVVYLPPVHPVGVTNRKGKNNTLTPKPDDVGSPWAIGGKEGGHEAFEPRLGNEKDFAYFVETARGLGMEVALDFALQCSPDHPWVKQHPEWFYRRPDGTIRYAENPPKKYEDIYPINFYGPHQEALWKAILEVVLLWVKRGVSIFRVDNPHTKSVPFWGWLIGEIQKQHPEVLFLAEAFTRPKMMRALAKEGFTQSYTYFTWRNTKYELTEYLNELTKTEMAEYYRPNFWPNTPDILHEFLQHGGRPAFKLRYVLAATLSSNVGIYSGYELCENVPLRPGSEEYLNSEKYELKHRTWESPHSIAYYIGRVNEARRNHEALQQTNNLRFVEATNDAVLAYVKQSGNRKDTVLTVVNLDPRAAKECTINVPAFELGLPADRPFVAEDLITGQKFTWKSGTNFVRLDPAVEPAHILWLHPEGEFLP